MTAHLPPSARRGRIFEARGLRSLLSLGVLVASSPDAPAPSPVEQAPRIAVTVDLAGPHHWTETLLLPSTQPIVLADNAGANVVTVSNLVPGARIALEDANEGVVRSIRPMSLSPQHGEGHRVVGVVELSSDVAVRLRTTHGWVEATDEHRFFVRERGWVPAAALRVDDAVVTSEEGRDERLLAVERTAVPMRNVYNLRVEGSPTFFVGPDHLLVHNGSCLKMPATPSARITASRGSSMRPPARGLPVVRATPSDGALAARKSPALAARDVDGVDIRPDSLFFENPTEPVAKLAPGDLVWSSQRDSTFVRRVVDVEPEGSGLRVTTEGMSLLDTGNAYTGRTRIQLPSGTIKAPALTHAEENGAFITCTKCNVTLDSALNLGFSMKGGRIDHVAVELEGRLASEVEIVANSPKLVGAAKELTLFKKTDKVGINVAGIPTPIQADVTTSVVARVEGNVFGAGKFTAAAKVDHARGGVIFDGQRWHEVHDIQGSTTFNPGTLVLDGAARARVAIVPRVEVKFYDVFTGHLRGQAAIVLETFGAGKAGGHWTASTLTEVAVGASVKRGKATSTAEIPLATHSKELHRGPLELPKPTTNHEGDTGGTTP